MLAGAAQWRIGPLNMEMGSVLSLRESFTRTQCVHLFMHLHHRVCVGVISQDSTHLDMDALTVSAVG